MNHYIDIQLNPDAEMRINLLMNNVFTKFHKALFDLKANDIGISFPHYKILLGNQIRIHGSESRLQQLQATNWLGSLIDYCNVSTIHAVPETTHYRNLARKQQNMTASKLRRLIKRGSITEQEAKHYQTKMLTGGLSEPYLELESASNGHKYRRYITHGNITSQPTSGEFDFFGLSKTATIPWF